MCRGKTLSTHNACRLSPFVAVAIVVVGVLVFDVACRLSSMTFDQFELKYNDVVHQWQQKQHGVLPSLWIIMNMQCRWSCRATSCQMETLIIIICYWCVFFFGPLQCFGWILVYTCYTLVCMGRDTNLSLASFCSRCCFFLLLFSRVKIEFNWKEATVKHRQRQQQQQRQRQQ